jgi:phosphate/sulfate permease
MLQSDMQALYFTHLKVWIAWRWRHCVSLKHCYLCSILRHIAIIQNATIWIFTAMKTLVLMVCILPLVFCWFCHAVMVLIECKQVNCEVEQPSHIKKRSEVLTAVARCSFVESSDVSRNPLSPFHSTLTVPPYAEQANLHHWKVPTTNNRDCYHDWNFMSYTSLSAENLWVVPKNRSWSPLVCFYC